MPSPKEAHSQPIPGYRLLEPIGSGGFGEVWKCEAPGGIFKAVKFVYGELNSLAGDSPRADEELRAIQRIKAIRHPFLLSMDRVENGDGELIIVMELADQNLQDVMATYQHNGRQGIPRRELLGYLREAAEVLDLMNQEHQLQHLDIKPRNLFLVSNHVKVADFGLVKSLSGKGNPAQIHLGAITPIYASPELFLGGFSHYSDQYSLAIVYQELLTGTLPFTGKNCRQLLFQHTKEEPDLRSLSAPDQGIVARALAKNPNKRFASCMAFIDALLAEREEAAKLNNGTSNGHSKPAKQPDKSTGDTVNIKVQDTTWGRAASPVPADLVPGYRFVECLGRSPLLDQWKVLGPSSKERIAKIPYGFLPGNQQKQAALQLKSIHHPGLVETEVISGPGKIVILSDRYKETLRDRAKQCQARKFPGIMRGELLEYLHAIAEVLDYLYHQHSIVHLTLNPRNLVLTLDGRVQVADFGLAQLLWLPGGQAVAQGNGRYAAPELFAGQASRTCDQYSLALIYHELLTGVHPLAGCQKGPGQGKPNLERLPDPDHEIIAKALDPDPAKRWLSLSAMVYALEGVQNQPESAEEADSFAAFLSASREEPKLARESSEENLNQLITELIAGVSGHWAKVSEEEVPTLSEAGDLLTHKFQVGLPLGSARLKLDSFCQQWFGQMIKDQGNSCVFHVNMPTNFWSQWIGRQPGLEIRIDLARVHVLSATPIEVAVQIRPFRCTKKRGRQLLQEMGASILDNLREHLLVNTEKRIQDRLLWPHPLKVCPVYEDGKRGETIQCTGKDISQTGIGFYLPDKLDTSDVLIHLPNGAHPASISVPATLVRAKRCADGYYEVGALFRLPTLRKVLPEQCLSTAGAR
jgi:serine/threonine protein kinase